MFNLENCDPDFVCALMKTKLYKEYEKAELKIIFLSYFEFAYAVWKKAKKKD